MTTTEDLDTPRAPRTALRLFQPRRLSAEAAKRNGLIILGSIVTILAALSWASLHARPDTRSFLTLLAFVATIVAAEQWRLQKAIYTTSAPVSSAVALALALTPLSHHSSSGASVILTVLTGSLLVGYLIHLNITHTSRHDTLPDISLRLITTLVGAVITLALPTMTISTPGGSTLGIVVLSVVALLCTLTDIGVRLLFMRHAQPPNSSDVSNAAGMASCIAATAVMITVSLPIFSIAAIPLCILPLALVHMSERLHLKLRTSYQESVDIFAHLNDISAHRPEGYCTQHSELCLAIGARLGLRDRELRRLGYASKMHAVGMLRLSNAGSPRAAADLHSIAHHSTEILRDTGLPLQIDDILAAIPVPHHDTDHTIPLASRIIRVVSTYLTHRTSHTGSDADAHHAAMESLYLGYCYEYDPRVIDALADLITPHGTPREIPLKV